MKKIVVCLLTGLLCFTNLFAQKIPEGRDILPLVMEFANDKDSWTECGIDSLDVTKSEYVVSGFAVQKIMIGFSRQSYTVSISRNGAELVVAVSDMTSVASDKDGNPVKNATKMANPKSTMTKLAGLIKDDLAGRISSWSDEEYQDKYNKSITNPMVLNTIANQSALVFKKFVNDNAIIGKPVEFNINVTKVDEAPKYAEGYAYYIGGGAFCGYKSVAGGIPARDYVTVMVYTNNDEALSLTPAEAMDALLLGGEGGSVYTVKGTIKDVKRKEIGGLAVIQVNE